MLAELAAAASVGGFGDDGVEACDADELAGAAAAGRVAYFGEDVAGEYGADAEDGAQRL